MDTENTNAENTNETTEQAFDIKPKNNNNEGNLGAAPESAEDATKGYESVIAEQSKQIDALMAHNERLYKQLEKMLENGAAITDNKQEEKPEDAEYVPLKALGSLFGTKDIYKE